MSNILVTGGTGFIGSHLVKELVKQGHQIIIIDNLFRSTTQPLQHLIDSNQLKFIEGDIRNEALVDQAMDGVDYVFHLAAVCINYSSQYPKESLDINLIGSDNIFRSALKHQVKRVIFSSSASVYGDPETLPMKEDGPLNPVTPYCAAKLACEHLLNFYSKSGLKFNALRYFNVYGLGQTADAYYTSVIIAFIKKILNNEAPIIAGDGKQSMDFINVKDVVQANLLAMNSEVENEIFNVGTNTSTTIAELANILIKSLNKDVQPQFDGRSVIVKQRRADITKIKNLLNFEITINADEGLTEVAKDIAQHPEKY